jgi:hypothetical protein
MEEVWILNFFAELKTLLLEDQWMNKSDIVNKKHISPSTYLISCSIGAYFVKVLLDKLSLNVSV